MRKKLLTIILTLVLISSLSFSFADEQVKLFINGKFVVSEESTTKPFLKDGRTFVPIRLVSETLGIEVKWDGATSTVTLIENSDKVSFKIGSDTALKNSKTKIKMASPAITIDGRTYVPLRFVAEAFGREVEWNDEHRTVVIGGGFDPSALESEIDFKDINLKKTDSKKEYIYTKSFDKLTVKNEQVDFEDNCVLDVKIPVINFESEDAKIANKEILSCANEAIANFKKYDKEKKQINVIVDYKAYKANNILTVVVSRSYYLFNAPNPHNLIYMFDIRTGNKIDLNEAIKICGYENMDTFKNSIYGSIEKWINDYYSTLDFEMPKEDLERSKRLDTVQSLFSAFESLKRNNCYVDNNGAIVLITNVFKIGYETASVQDHVTILKKHNYKAENNPIFKGLNISSDKDAIVSFVGAEYVGNEKTTENIEKIDKIMTKYAISLKDTSFIATYNDGERNGKELYFISAKYKNAPIRIAAISEDPKYQAYNYIIADDALGNAVVRCNQSELRNDTIVQILIDGEIISFSPSISMQDGSVYIPKEIKNVIDVTEKIENAIKDVKPKGIKDLNKKYFDGIFPNNVG